MQTFKETYLEFRKDIIKTITNNLDLVNQKLNENTILYAEYEDEFNPLFMRTEPIIGKEVKDNGEIIAYPADEDNSFYGINLTYFLEMLTTESLIKLVE